MRPQLDLVERFPVTEEDAGSNPVGRASEIKGHLRGDLLVGCTGKTGF